MLDLSICLPVLGTNINMMNRKIRKLNCSNLDDLLFRNNVYTGKYIPDSNAWKEMCIRDRDISTKVMNFRKIISAHCVNMEL